ncbi:MAG: hypothetical protein ACI4TA_03150, partial [Acetatifactor sp.]
QFGDATFSNSHLQLSVIISYNKHVCELSRCLGHRNMAGYFYFKEPEVHQNQKNGAKQPNG